MDEIKNEMVIPFTMVPNEILRDSGLSLKQKGMMCYLLSLPKDWVIYKSELQAHFTDGRDAISVAIEDLVDLGFISKKEKPKEKGKFSGYTYTIKPLLENRYGLSATENPLLIKTNKENTNKIIDSKLSNAELPTSTTANVKLSDNDKCRLFIDKFNEIKKSKYKANSQICGKLKQRLKDYEVKIIFKALRLALADEYHIKNNLKWVTPEYILRPNIIDKYINQITEIEEKRELVH